MARASLPGFSSGETHLPRNSFHGTATRGDTKGINLNCLTNRSSASHKIEKKALSPQAVSPQNMQNTPLTVLASGC
jgi:hypothetical protein